MRVRSLVLLVALGAGGATAGVPPTLTEVLEARPDEKKVVGFGDERRRSAMRDAAVGFGTQSALVRRWYELVRMVERYGRQLDRVYRFDRLLIVRDGFLVAPPVVVETTGAFRRDAKGSKAVTARWILRIERAAEVLGGAPGWRGYFDRAWEEPRAPSVVLFPRTAEERGLWRGWVTEGWEEGRGLAEDTFEADLDRLDRDFVGIVNWRILEAQRIVTAPRLEVVTRPVVGGGERMRVGEREIRIVERARLNPVSEDWKVIEESVWAP